MHTILVSSRLIFVIFLPYTCACFKGSAPTNINNLGIIVCWFTCNNKTAIRCTCCMLKYIKPNKRPSIQLWNSKCCTKCISISLQAYCLQCPIIMRIYEYTCQMFLCDGLTSAQWQRQSVSGRRVDDTSINTHFDFRMNLWGLIRICTHRNISFFADTKMI